MRTRRTSARWRGRTHGARRRTPGRTQLQIQLCSLPCIQGQCCSGSRTICAVRLKLVRGSSHRRPALIFSSPASFLTWCPPHPGLVPSSAGSAVILWRFLSTGPRAPGSLLVSFPPHLHSSPGSPLTWFPSHRVPSPSSPGSPWISAAFPPHRSPCSSAGVMSRPVKNDGSFGKSCDARAAASRSPYCAAEQYKSTCIHLVLLRSNATTSDSHQKQYFDRKKELTSFSMRSSCAFSRLA